MRPLSSVTIAFKTKKKVRGRSGEWVEVRGVVRLYLIAIVVYDVRYEGDNFSLQIVLAGLHGLYEFASETLAIHYVVEPSQMRKNLSR